LGDLLGNGYDNTMTTEPDNQLDQPRRRWRWQFSLLLVLLVMTLVGVIVGVYVVPDLRRRARQVKLEAYQAKWHEMGFRLNVNASWDDEVIWPNLTGNGLTRLPLSLVAFRSLLGTRFLLL